MPFPALIDASLWANYLNDEQGQGRQEAALALVEALGPMGADELLAMASGPSEGKLADAMRLRHDLLLLASLAAEHWSVPRVGMEAALELGEWPRIRAWARISGAWAKAARWAAHQAQSHWRPPSPDAAKPFRLSDARPAALNWARALAAAARSQEAMPEAFAWPIAAALAGVAAQSSVAMGRSIQNMASALGRWAGPGGLAAVRLGQALSTPVQQAGPCFASAWALACEAESQANFSEAMALAVGARAMLAQSQGEEALAWLEAAAGS